MGSEEQTPERPKKKSQSKDNKYILESSENIVDLADIKAMSNIASKYHKSFENQ